MNYILAIFSAIPQGLTWAILALGVYISFRILNFADLSVEGSFALGGSVSAVLIVVLQLNPILSILVATLAGMMAGAITGLLHTKLKIPAILSGILTMIGLYSINLRIMGRANTPLIGKSTVISMVKDLFPTASELGIKDSTLTTNVVIIVGLIFTIGTIFLLYWFFGTELGSCIRATGNNEAMVRAQGVNTDKMKIFGLVLSNGLIAMSGALVTQSQGYADVGMGVGAIVIGLASIVVGEVIFYKARHFAFKLAIIVIGSIAYRSIIALVLQLGFNPNDMKLFTAVIVALCLSLPIIKQSISKIGKGGNV